MPNRFPFVNSQGGQPLVRYLDTNGDGTGTNNAVADYSATSAEFFIQAPPGESFIIYRMIISLANGNMRPDQYGGSGGALSNGIAVRMQSSRGVLDLLDGVPITTNGDWNFIAHDRILDEYGSATSQTLTVRWTFARFGGPLVLNGTRGDQLVVECSDDLTGLSTHRFMIQGYRVEL